jgi:hypothetical protein
VDPVPLSIEPADLAEWKRLQQTDARAASVHYFRRILPKVVEYHQLRRTPVQGFDFLLSLMGMSPETTVLTVNFLRPRKLIVAVSRNAEDYFHQCAAFLAASGLLPHSAVRMIPVDSSDYLQMHALLVSEICAMSGKRIVDVTGGKKIMSAVAAAAAWALGLPICYLESQAYNEEMRRPAPGSEELIVLPPPAAGLEATAPST